MAAFPDLFMKMPEADHPFPGIRMRLLRGPTASAIFVEALVDSTVVEHAHGAQWGIVVEGEMELSIGGVRRTYGRGDDYTIPAGVRHGATLRAGARVIDVFDDPDRYRPKA